MQKYISQLNEAQQEPVLQKDGPMIIIAGAGSGKTTCIANRICKLIEFFSYRIGRLIKLFCNTA